MIDYAGSSITGKPENRMAGGSVVRHIEENLTFNYLHRCLTADRFAF